MGEAPEEDLVVLVPGRDEQAALEGLLSRPEALGIRPVGPVFYRHPDRDAGCLLRAHLFLRPQVRRFRHALVLFDRVGCGREPRSREELEAEVQSRMSASGWGDRAAAVVIDPELEAWVWSDSPHVAEELGWARRQPALDEWLVAQGLLTEGQVKPPDPKETVHRALREAAKGRSSAIYAQLAETVGLGRCVDPAFAKLREVLLRWFAADRPASGH